VIERAIADWKRFADQGRPLKMAVNMPLCVITTPDFISLLRHYLPADVAISGPDYRNHRR
jgi:hypothetical protein